MPIIPLPRPIYFGMHDTATRADIVGNGWASEVVFSPGDDAPSFGSVLNLFTAGFWGLEGAARIRYQFPATDEITIGFHIRRSGFINGGINGRIFYLSEDPLFTSDPFGVATTENSDNDGVNTPNFLQGNDINEVLAVASMELTQQYQFLEVAVRLNTVDGSLHVWQNGELVISMTNIDTIGAAANSCQVLSFRSVGTSTDINVNHIADGYIKNGAGPGANIGRIEWFDKVVDSNESPQDWTPDPVVPAFQNLDEPIENRDTDFIRSTIVGDQNRHGLVNANLEETPPFIYPYAVARLPSGGSDRAIIRLHSGASQINDLFDIPPVAWSTLGFPVENDPGTSNPWTPGGIDNVEIEVEHEAPA